ncbi:Protein cwh43 [Rhizoctonia solani AG-1 IB]|uniref:Protein cwh43 n=1 Tax=Thanatephorus cucumeris (strain AG1-IB / isolate 7/3/14) TaxID=1108050 RepID=M5C4J8_THACB|nr:Protein cwh43 [Rhizoctonia solani AG-1 IB]
MGSSSSKSRVTKHGNASTKGSSRGVSGASIGTGSSGRKRVTADQMQSTHLEFPEIVTFNPIYSHLECYIRQLNWWILDGKLKGAPFRFNKGGPAGPTGECGSVGQWNHCKMNEKYKQPPASRYIGAAAPGFNLEAGLSQTIQTTLQICHQQPLEDANVRTALLYLVERLAYQGVAIRTDLDIFSIYAHLKSMSTTGYAPPPEDEVGSRIMNIMGLAAFRAPVEWEHRMELANRIKVELHADILEVQLYYQELQQLSGRMDELRRRVSQAREQAQAHIAKVEGILEHSMHQPDSAVGLSSIPRASASASMSTSGSGSISTSRAAQLPSSTTTTNPMPVSIAAQTGLPGAVTLNSYSEPAIPSDRLTFSYLWKLWALQSRKTQQDIPTLGGKFLDLQLLALNITSLGGQAKMNRSPRLWKRLAVQLKLIDHETQDDEHSKRIVDMLRKTQEELLLPFEQYCVAWSRLSEEERNKSLVEYATATKTTKAKLPSPTPEISDTLLPIPTMPARGSTLPPNSPELQEAMKLVDFYFHGFYPGIPLRTKIERLLELPPSELPKHTWTRKRIDWLSKFSQTYAGRSTDQIIAYMAAIIPQHLAQQLPGKKPSTVAPPSGWPVNNVKLTEVPPPTSSAMFPPALIIQANQFVDITLQAVESVRPMRRFELPDAHHQPLKALVNEAYDLALFFYRASALHYMLFIDDKETRGGIMHIVKNGVAGWPQEWWPSVSATIGDWYPERNLFQILIALTSGPRFALVFLWWFVTRTQYPRAAAWIAACGVIRTVACGGWVYITSNDDHDAHDILMILYVICNLPWMIGSISYTPHGQHLSRKRRKIVAISFFGALPPMIYFFIRHKVQRIPGAYTHYSFFEWWLIISDVAFDSLKSAEFSTIEISIRTVGSSSAEIEKYGKRSLTGPVSTQSPKVDTSLKALPTGAKDKKPGDAAANTPLDQGSLIKSVAFSPAATFAADLYLSYCSWSVYTSLAISLFYFNIWELGVTGSELAVISTLTPFWLGIRSFRESVASHTGQVVTRACMILGMAAYATDEPLGRLFVVAFANMALGIDWAITWSGLSSHVSPWDNSLTFAAGFIIANLSKMANHSNNPVWPIVDSRSGGWNKTGLSLALLALAQFASRPPTSTTREAVMTDRPGTWMSGVGLGGTIFALYSLFADSGTIVAWSWTGYPIKGPVPGVTSSSVTISALCAGLALASSSSASRVVNHPAWLSIGVGACFVMYQYRDWVGYAGGLVYGFFLMSIFPKMLQESSFRGSAWVYYLMWLTVIGLILADVWATAYAFVPGGVYMRERTDIVLAAEVFAIGCGMVNWGRRMKGSGEAQPAGASSLPAFTKLKSRVRATLGIVMLLTMSVVLHRTPRTPPVPHHSGDRLITAGIWTMHFGQDNEGRDSQRRMRNLIRDMELDVVGLLETDLHRTVFGHRDLTQVIAEELGYYVGKSWTRTQLPYLGCCPSLQGKLTHIDPAVVNPVAETLFQFPILNSTHHLLPSPNGELAPAISAVIDAWGTKVHVVVSHNGQEEDPLDRELQSKKLGEIMNATFPEPTIFLGYVVTKPQSPRPAPYFFLTEDGRMHDIDHLDWDRWCEYILYRGLWRVGYARVSRSTITDTELQGKPSLFFHHDRYIRSRKEDMPSGYLFNEAYYPPHGKNGHVYHVFNYPLHYRIPDYAPL